VDWASEQLGGLDILISNVTAGGSSFRDCVETDIISAPALMQEGFHLRNISLALALSVYLHEQPPWAYPFTILCRSERGNDQYGEIDGNGGVAARHKSQNGIIGRHRA
jgi:hypothetical protein